MREVEGRRVCGVEEADVHVAADGVVVGLVGRGRSLRGGGRAVARGVVAQAVIEAREQVVAARGDDGAVGDDGDDDRRVNTSVAAPDQCPAGAASDAYFVEDGDVVVRRVVKLDVLVAAAADRQLGGADAPAFRAGAGVAQLRDDDAARGGDGRGLRLEVVGRAVGAGVGVFADAYLEGVHVADEVNPVARGAATDDAAEAGDDADAAVAAARVDDLRVGQRGTDGAQRLDVRAGAGAGRAVQRIPAAAQGVPRLPRAGRHVGLRATGAVGRVLVLRLEDELVVGRAVVVVVHVQDDVRGLAAGAADLHVCAVGERGQLVHGWERRPVGVRQRRARVAGMAQLRGCAAVGADAQLRAAAPQGRRRRAEDEVNGGRRGRSRLRAGRGLRLPALQAAGEDGDGRGHGEDDDAREKENGCPDRDGRDETLYFHYGGSSCSHYRDGRASRGCCKTAPGRREGCGDRARRNPLPGRRRISPPRPDRNLLPQETILKRRLKTFRGRLKTFRVWQNLSES